MNRKHYVSLADLRSIPPDEQKTFYVTSARKILSARNACNYLKRVGEIEEGYRYTTIANYEEVAITIKKERIHNPKDLTL